MLDNMNANIQKPAGTIKKPRGHGFVGKGPVLRLCQGILTGKRPFSPWQGIPLQFGVAEPWQSALPVQKKKARRRSAMPCLWRCHIEAFRHHPAACAAGDTYAHRSQQWDPLGSLGTNPIEFHSGIVWHR